MQFETVSFLSGLLFAEIGRNGNRELTGTLIMFEPFLTCMTGLADDGGIANCRLDRNVNTGLSSKALRPETGLSGGVIRSSLLVVEPKGAVVGGGRIFADVEAVGRVRDEDTNDDI